MKKIFLTISILSMCSVEVLANSRTNSVLSDSTLPSVGHRPEPTSDIKKLTISGSLTTGETLTITDIGMTDVDGDLLAMERTTQSVKWYLVDNDASPLPEKPDGSGGKFTIPSGAAGKKIKVEYQIMTDENSTNPDQANEKNQVLLTTATSGVTGGQADTGLIIGKIATVRIQVNKTPTIDENGTDIAGTPIVGSILTAILTCDASVDASACDISNYDFQWQIAEAGTDNFVDMISVGGVPSQHQVQGSQQNKLFRVMVSPKAATP
ncbi:ZirU family protein [Citrobacter portucalensis]|uniref:ZirU family protein n=1 Tax=Citrobacter portucalensis TaxID=1639133 RepID=UPI0039FC8375